MRKTLAYVLSLAVILSMTMMPAGTFAATGSAPAAPTAVKAVAKQKRALSFRGQEAPMRRGMPYISMTARATKR